MSSRLQARRREAQAPARGAASRTALLCALVFLAALGVRALAWQDSRLEAAKVQWGVTADYKRVARLLAEGGAASFFSTSSPLANPDTLGHPPGYSILLALSYALFGERDEPVQVFQLACDALAAVVIFLITAELLGIGVGAAAGLMSALAPQFSWNSVSLLPDTLAVLPVLLAVYCLALAARGGEAAGGGRRRLLALLFVSGALVGVSCWLRANAMLLAPFMAGACLLLFGRGVRLRAASALLLGALAVVAPLTIRNALVFRHFIPLSLGAGQTMLEGIADYDDAGRFGIPKTDLAITRMEAAEAGRPDYAGALFGADGVARERARVRRALGVVRAHPLWFAGVMARRGASMLRLERARLVSAEPPVTHELPAAGFGDDPRASAHGAGPRELISEARVGAQTKAALVEAGAPTGGEGGPALSIEGDGSKYGEQLATSPLPVSAGKDYLLSLVVKELRGRMRVGVVGVEGESVITSTLVEEAEGLAPEAQPWTTVRLPFVSRGVGAVRVVFRNEGPSPAALVSAARLDELGPASGLWTRYPRLLVRGAQRVFLTATVLPLAAAGLLLLASARRFRALLILLLVPAYYAAVQSAVHTEYRYILAVYHFVFACAAVSVVAAAGAARAKLAGRGAVQTGRAASSL